MTPEEKASRARDRLIEKSREYTIGTYSRKVAAIFQKMIRAEAGALDDGSVPVIVGGGLVQQYRCVGQVVCVTCGKVQPWSGGLGGMHTGHFLASRVFAILFEEDNVAPQCSACNRYRNGEPQKYRQWMLAVRGEETVERLEQLKRTNRHFDREELVDLRISYTARLKVAIETMGG